MKILFIGGSGVISRAVTHQTIAAGHELWLLNRGQHRPVDGARTLRADTTDLGGMRAALQGHRWDVVVDWIAFAQADVRRDIELFRESARQFIFISSASIYQKPPEHYLITEETPRVNPHWDYSRNKIACEDELMAAHHASGFPVTIVRPSLTFGEDQIPLALNAWKQSWTLIDRMRRGGAAIIPGDGTSLWTITHNTDFAPGLIGLFGQKSALGQAFHITSDEVLTWNQIFRQTAEAAGIQNPRFVHIASDFIVACMPETEGSLLGDKSVSAVFDNSKIKRLVPGFAAKTRFAEGIKRTIAWFDAHPDQKVVDAETNRRLDQLIGSYDAGLAQARKSFGV